MRKKSQKICDLSNSWPAHTASWQSVFGFLYWGAHPDEPGHNRSSSPFTTLADIAERKVASTGAGQPNYWPKTWFGANAYNAKFGVPNYKSVRTLLPSCGALRSPWQIKKKYQSVRVLFDKIIKKEKKEERRKVSKLEPQNLGRKLFPL